MKKVVYEVKEHEGSFEIRHYDDVQVIEVGPMKKENDVPYFVDAGIDEAKRDLVSTEMMEAPMNGAYMEFVLEDSILQEEKAPKAKPMVIPAGNYGATSISHFASSTQIESEYLALRNWLDQKGVAYEDHRYLVRYPSAFFAFRHIEMLIPLKEGK